MAIIRNKSTEPSKKEKKERVVLEEVPPLKFKSKPQKFRSLQEDNIKSYPKPIHNSAPNPRRKQFGAKNKKYTMGKSLNKDVRKALSTGVGVAEEMGSLGMKVGKTSVTDIEGVGMEGMRLGKKSMKFGKKMLTMKKKKSKKKGKSSKLSKNSYRSYLSKRLKEVKKAHPSWPQSKVFIEAVKGWKTSK